MRCTCWTSIVYFTCKQWHHKWHHQGTQCK